MMARIVFRYPTSIREVYVSDMPAILRNGLAFRLGQLLPDNNGTLWVEDTNELKFRDVTDRHGAVYRIELEHDSVYGTATLAAEIAERCNELIALRKSWGCC